MQPVFSEAVRYRPQKLRSSPIAPENRTDSGDTVGILRLNLHNREYIERRVLGPRSAEFWGLGRNRGLINREYMAVDMEGRGHVLLSHMPDEQESDSDFTGL